MSKVGPYCQLILALMSLGTLAPLAVAENTLAKNRSNIPLPAPRPDVVNDEKGATPSGSKPSAQPLSEVRSALLECIEILAPIAVEAKSLPPFQEGNCGNASPMRLSAIGIGINKVIFKPDPKISCAMIGSLHGWIQNSVQRLSVLQFGQPVSMIVSGDGYACRKRIGKGEDKLSEHAYANAIDIIGFLLADGTRISVRKDWGPSDLGESAEEGKSPDGGTLSRKKRGKKQRPTTIETDMARVQKEKLSNKSKFLRSVHHEACSYFSTVLGPNTNKAHRTHFHFDMARRSNESRYCR